MNIYKILRLVKVASSRSPEVGSSLVRLSNKINSASSSPQLIKIGKRYFRVRELG